MAEKRASLGRNLSALLSQPNHAPLVVEKPQATPTSLPAAYLQPGKYQPRGDIEEDALAELAESIRKQGLLQPLIVRKITEDRYEIIAGERRWRACQLAGVQDIPVLLRQVDDETAMAMALVENLQREDLNAMDQAKAMYRLVTEFALTHHDIAELLSKSRTAVSNYLRLLNLCETVKRRLECGELDMGHARCLLSLNESEQAHVASIVVAKNLSVRETEALVQRMKGSHEAWSARKENGQVSSVPKNHLENLAEILQAKISLRQGKAGKGALLIHYEDESALKRVMGKLSEIAK